MAHDVVDLIELPSVPAVSTGVGEGIPARWCISHITVGRFGKAHHRRKVGVLR